MAMYSLQILRKNPLRNLSIDASLSVTSVYAKHILFIHVTENPQLIQLLVAKLISLVLYFHVALFEQTRECLSV